MRSLVTSGLPRVTVLPSPLVIPDLIRDPLCFCPGYRVYFVQRGEDLIVLLCGGDKSTQDADIAEAKAMAKELD